MSITQSVCLSFKQELATGTHNFTLSSGNVFKIALYTSAATISGATTVYTTSGEVVGTGYTAGGLVLTNITPQTGTNSSSQPVAYWNFQNATWAAATITARGALIYNSTNGNKAVAVLDFGADKTSTAGDFTIQFPTNDADYALLILN